MTVNRKAGIIMPDDLADLETAFEDFEKVLKTLEGVAGNYADGSYPFGRTIPARSRGPLG